MTINQTLGSLALSITLFSTPALAVYSKLGSGDRELQQIRNHLKIIHDDISQTKSSYRKIRGAYKDFIDNKFTVDGVIEVLHCQSSRGYIFDQQLSKWKAYKDSVLKNHHESDLEGICGEDNFERGWRKKLNSTVLMNTEHITIYDKDKILDVYYDLLKFELEQLKHLTRITEEMTTMYHVAKNQTGHLIMPVRTGVTENISHYIQVIQAHYSKTYSRYESHYLQLMQFRHVSQLEERTHQVAGTDQLYTHLNDIQYESTPFIINATLLDNKRQRNLSNKFKNIQATSSIALTDVEIHRIEAYSKTSEVFKTTLEKTEDELRSFEKHRVSIHRSIRKTSNEIKDRENDIKDDWKSYTKKVKKAAKKGKRPPQRSQYVDKERQNRDKISQLRHQIRIFQAQLAKESYDEVNMVYTL